MHTIVLFHGPNCIDGLVAAWSLGLDPQTTIYLGYDHSKPLIADVAFHRTLANPAHTVTRVIAVDCFPEFVRGSAKDVVVIDHHDSAKERLADRTGLTEVVFDQTHSAAVLAYRWAHPNAVVPELNKYVEDRDIWNWELPSSHAVNAFIGTKPLEMESISNLLGRLQNHESFYQVVVAGNAILDYQAQVIASAVSRAQVRVIDGVRCAVVNATTLVSETGHALVDGTDTPVALLYRIDGNVLNVSVRTAKDSPIKANAFAARFGGGGHPQAAGFHLPAATPPGFLA